MLKFDHFTNPKLILDPMRKRWDTLSTRDQWALSLLIIFLILVFGGFGALKLRQASQAQIQEYQEAVSEYFWLRDQAANINIRAIQDNDDQVADIEIRVRELLRQAGAVNPQVITVNDKLQVAFTHPNQAIASKILANLTQTGLVISRLDMQQNPQDKSVSVKTTLSP